MRTSLACVSSETRSVLLSCWAKRLKDLGSVRMQAAIAPPRVGLTEPDAGAGADPHADSTKVVSTTSAKKNATERECLVKNCPAGQKFGLSNPCETWPTDAILRA